MSVEGIRNGLTEALSQNENQIKLMAGTAAETVTMGGLIVELANHVNRGVELATLVTHGAEQMLGRIGGAEQDGEIIAYNFRYALIGTHNTVAEDVERGLKTAKSFELSGANTLDLMTQRVRQAGALLAQALELVRPDMARSAADRQAQAAMAFTGAAEARAAVSERVSAYITQELK